MSNTANVKADKGSKFWIQEIANNIVYKNQLDEMLRDNLKFFSPLESESYKEYQLREPKIFSEVLGLTKYEFNNKFSFWANNQPHWDAIAISADKKILYLFEAKAHLKELHSKISATDFLSIEKIISAMRNVHGKIASVGSNFEIWRNKYYQLGNRLTFLYNLNQMHLPKIRQTNLILLNIIDDQTYIPTSRTDWIKNYEKVFIEMTGKKNPPANVKLLYFAGR